MFLDFLTPFGYFVQRSILALDVISNRVQNGARKYSYCFGLKRGLYIKACKDKVFLETAKISQSGTHLHAWT